MLKEELAKARYRWVGCGTLTESPGRWRFPTSPAAMFARCFPILWWFGRKATSFSIDILEPHDPSLGDNFEKAVGLARFAEKHGALFGRIQLIRKQASAGGEHFVRLEINQAATIKKLLLITSNPSTRRGVCDSSRLRRWAHSQPLPLVRINAFSRW